MQSRPRSLLLLVVMALAGVAVLKSHQRRSAVLASPTRAAVSGDPWADALLDEDAPSPAAQDPSLDPYFVSDLSYVIQNLRDLVKDGEARCESLGEPRYEAGHADAKGKAQIAAWNSFAREWGAKLDEAASDLPDPIDGDAQPEGTLAYQEVGRAIQELRLVPTGTGEWPTPFESLWSSRFQTAGLFLNSAAARLESAGPSH